jgi:hypothetical protein
MKQKSDSVFLLTLVDLLVQIIFLVIFVGAVYIASEGKEDVEKKQISDPNAKIILEVGVLNVAELINAMVKLVPIDRLKELVVLLPEFKSIEALKAALRLATTAKFDPDLLDKQNKELQKKISVGVGKPVCRFATLFTLEEQNNSYNVTKITPKAKALFSELKINLSEGSIINFEQFDTIGKSISSTEKDCRFLISYVPSTNDSLTAYRNVSKYFYSSFPSRSRVKN